MDIKKVIAGLGPYEQSRLEKTQAEEAKARRSSKQHAAPAAGDKVSVSSDAMLRAEAHTHASSAEDIRREKVAAIKAQIANGEYQMNTRKIAENIVKDDLDFFS